MLSDSQGLEVTTDSLLTIAAINHYSDQALAYGKEAVTIFKGIEADPECAIANAHAAAFYLSHECAESRRKAVPYLEAARRYKHKTTEREPALTSNQQGLIHFPAQKTTDIPATTCSKVDNAVSTDVAVKSQVINKPNQATHWTEQLSHFQRLALAKTYATIIEIGGHLSA